MRFEFDLSAQALSLDASGAAAHAIGVCQTLTLAAEIGDAYVELPTGDAGTAGSAGVTASVAPAVITFTL